MSQDIYRRVEADPAFRELKSSRNRLAVTLSVLVLGAYYGFMAIVAFAPGIFGQPLFAGSTLTLGIPVGAALIVGSWLLTGWYVRCANGQFDRLTREIVERNK
ncbi:DUF485 domain-containing protein [uncultured Aquabacterium sp.]|jgi:uncharacterized membrane protein (DUF485 family)|uniref:DUF485 domain-containing protein n=1 Tax=uncultured Aquabacterium sp. TaxID=158753 RepID=UPI00261015F6|nr:DUF485 domain-containing protein [uncultured Aquabacterium sp.]